MRKLLQVLRRNAPEATPVWQTFAFESEDQDVTVATALRMLNERTNLRDVDGNPAEPIRWESSCLQKKCGACAMVIDGTPRLACDTKLAALPRETVRLEPLRKFPVVADLLVDRSALMENLAEAESWLEGVAELPNKRWEIAYEASRCLQCGLCLEVCPNFSVQGAFGGMAAMAPLARLLAQAPKSQRSELAAAYREKVYGGCGKSLACRNVCPAELDIDKLLSRSNAAAVWRRW
ncbi:MAG: 2Fe-2S iron-sulfur cluster-binding protein [Coriobacteriales bacterium]|nr:2Fe-2S iron-sulfur cluster-binding protein [Coriobacteriales bacterium]